jgi:tRNA/rRNA methyltransferase
VAKKREPSGEELLERIRIVLVRPRGSANVGAVARSMKNMGMRQLTIVGPVPRRRGAETMAVHARDVLDDAREVKSLAEAVADCHLVIGTTGRDGLYEAGARDPAGLAPLAIERARGGPVALVFGPEDHGLSKQDLKYCQRLITIDTSSAYTSMNLSHAVVLCCYELRRCALQSEAPREGAQPLAPAGDVNFMFERLQTALLRVGFLRPENPDHIMYALRRVLGRAALEPHDVRIFLGIARQVRWYARDGWRRDAS